MKMLLVTRQNLEIARMPLAQERFLVGRSPHCEVVARAPGISPVHFLVEWIGEGAFNAKNGIWTIYDLTKTGETDEKLLEGIVLSEEDEYDYAGLKIKIVDAGLEAAHDFKGGISRSLEEERKRTGDKSLLEMVTMRRDSHVIEKIAYLDRRGSGKINEYLDSDYADLKFKWSDKMLKIDSRLPDNCQLMKGAEVVASKGGDLEQVPLKDDDFWTVRTPSYSVYLRFVPRIKIPKVKEESKVEPGFWFKYWMIVLGGFTLVLLVYYASWKQEKVPDEAPRIARIEVQDYVPPPPPPPEPEPVKEEKLPEKAPEKAPDQKVDKEKNSAPIQKRADKEAAAAQAMYHKEKSTADIGLRSPAPVKNVNQVGLLGAFKKAPGEGRLTADQLMSGTVATEMADTQSGRIAIKSPPSGALGVSKPGKKIGAGGHDGFTGASTTVSSDKVFDQGSTGPIARSRSNAKGFTLGTGAGGEAGMGTTGSFGDIGGSELSVSGGLDKETVRRVINQFKRQIKACYDQQLMLQPTLEGRIKVDWVISESGRVQTASAVTNTTRSAPLESCLLTVVRAMKFPEAPNGKSTRVIYPWQFTR